MFKIPNRLKIILGLTLLILSLVVCDEEEGPTSAPPPKSTPTPTVQTSAPDIPAGQQIYNNPDLAFSVYTPLDWFIDESQPEEQGIVIYPDPDSFSYVQIERFSFADSPSEANQAALDYAEEILNALEVDEMIIGERTANLNLSGLETVSLDYEYTYEEYPYLGSIFVVTTDQGDTYFITLELDLTTDEDRIDDLTAIVNSLQISGFADTQPLPDNNNNNGQVTAPPTERDGEAEWLIMLYMVADDNVLERDILVDFNEAERIGSTDQVHIVAQVDRYNGAFAGMGDWTTTKRFYLTQDSDLNAIRSQEVLDLGELNMADGDTLVDFITWATVTYPARKHAIIMSDHGSGWPGGYYDPAPGGRGEHDIFLAEVFEDGIWLMELDEALGNARANTGLDKFEFVGFDACLMAQIEVFTALAPHARYSVASEELEPGVGWAYTAFLGDLTANPTMDGADLATSIVDGYIQHDQRIVDPVARQQFSDETFGFIGTTLLKLLGAEYTAEELTEMLSADITLSAIDLSVIPQLNQSLNNLIDSMGQINQDEVAEARVYAQTYQTGFDPELPSPYIDLGHFAQRLKKETKDDDVENDVDNLLALINQAVISEKHGPERPGSSGISFYFPVRKLYNLGNNMDYNIVAERFVNETLWDEFLAFHLSKSTRADRGSGSTGTTATTRFKGALPAVSKPIELNPITLSDEVAAIDYPITLSTEVSGDHLSYIFSFIGRFSPTEDVLIIEDIDYVFADESQEVDGVTYPVWPEEDFSLDYNWEPIIYAISDGTNAVRTLFEPETYGNSPIYSVIGTYHFGDGSPDRFAKLFFRDGELYQIFGFTGQNGLGAPREITPQSGDQFTVFEQGEYLSEDVEDTTYYAEAGTLTFGAEPFYIQEIPAPSGNYIVGFIAEDFNGNTYEQYEGLFVANEEASSVQGFAPYINFDMAFALLYPENWIIEQDNQDFSSVFIYDENSSALSLIVADSYAEASSPAEANDLALQDLISLLSDEDTLTDLEFVTEVDEFILGAFEAKIIDFTFSDEGQPFYGSIIVSTPTPEITYGFIMAALDNEYEAALAQFEPMIFSFDLLISGVEKEQAGPPPPALAQAQFTDDFSDLNSGLVSDEEIQEWGRGYYNNGQYSFELTPNAGSIYDYYLDKTLDDTFLIEATATYQGAANNGYGLIFQVVQSQELEDFYTFRISGDGFYTVEKTTPDSFEPIIDWTESYLIDQTPGANNTLTILGTGDSYTLYINGQQVDHFTDTAYTQGTFGLIVDNYDLENPVSFSFNNYSVGLPAN